MLQSIELENFILFEKTAFTFSAGLNAVSGETGAGKSLVARALALALGGRGSHDIIRSGQEYAKITAVFHISDQNSQQAERRVERYIRRDGGNKLLLDGKPASIHAIRQEFGQLVDFAAQNEQVRLAEPGYQLALLDAYGRLGKEAETYASLFKTADTYAKRLKAGREERELVSLRLAKAREEFDSLEALDLDPDRDFRLEDDIREMANASAVVQAASEAIALVESGEPSAVDALGQAKNAIVRFASASARLAEAGDRLETALDAIQESVKILVEAGESAGADPERLDAMISRSEKLKKLARRFGVAVEGLPAERDKLAKEIAELSEWDAGEDEVRAKLDAVLPRLAEAGMSLRGKRQSAAGKLAKAVNRELAGLGMEQAGFNVEFEPLWDQGMPLTDLLAAGPAGLDEINFFLSPNPGEAASSLAHAASGGEASRAILAIKSALSAVYRPDVMFLDEIDAGVGARLGRELGVKLRELAATRQILVITHLPQIAAYAETHLKVAKKVKSGRTTAWVESLSGEDRIEEVAMMIHGSSANATTREQAKEMLAEGGGSN